jgi:hypothetical protein
MFLRLRGRLKKLKKASPEKIKKDILTMANRLFYKFGVMPDSFLKQPLLNYVRTVSVTQEVGNEAITDLQTIDDMGL